MVLIGWKLTDACAIIVRTNEPFFAGRIRFAEKASGRVDAHVIFLAKRPLRFLTFVDIFGKERRSNNDMIYLA